MTMVTQFVGLDVHANSISLAVAPGNGNEPRFLGKIPNDWATLLKKLRRLGPLDSIYTCYEAGPMGYELYRRMHEAGITCLVAAPSLIPKKPGEKVKTDRRDALNLSRCLRAGDLTGVWVPDEEALAMRELTRGREASKRAQKKVRQQIDKFLLRYGVKYPGRKKWGPMHTEWIRKRTFEHEAAQYTYDQFVAANDEATARVAAFDSKIGELVKRWSLFPLVQALQAFRGIALTTAAGIATEIVDFQRFSSPKQLMAYLGLTPSEHSSGDKTKRSSITGAGNSRVRRLLVESSWNYRMRPRMSSAIAKRNEPVTAGVRAIAWKAQQRLCNRYRRMCARGKETQKVVIAIARELTGFLWAAAREPELMAQIVALRVREN